MAPAFHLTRSVGKVGAPPRHEERALVELLQRDQGAKLNELIAATGWLPHTARAALTGLRHRGYDVRLERGEGALRSTAPWRPSHSLLSLDATEWEKLSAAADGHFGRRALRTDRRIRRSQHNGSKAWLNGAYVEPGATARGSDSKGRLSDRLAALTEHTLGELRLEWRRLFRAESPRLCRDIMTRAIAYRLQEIVQGARRKRRSADQ